MKYFFGFALQLLLLTSLKCQTTSIDLALYFPIVSKQQDESCLLQAYYAVVAYSLHSMIPYDSIGFPNITGGSNQEETIQILVQKGFALKYKALPKSKDSLVGELLNGKPIVVTLPWDDAFSDDSITTLHLNKRAANTEHAVVITGISNGNFIIRNSFGPAWGNNGYAYIPVDNLLANLIDAHVVMSVGRIYPLSDIPVSQRN